jgi:hypothetical protein
MLCARPPTSRVAITRQLRVVSRPLVVVPRVVVLRALQAPVAPPTGAMEMLEARAILRFVRGSPNKMRRVLDTIRGKTYEDALKILTFMPYKCALRAPE